MAITQQMARLSFDQLLACRASVDVLDSLCSFTLLPASDHLDLDWASAPLIRAFEIGLPAAAATLSQALHGAAEINPAYRDRADSIFEHPVTELVPAAVCEIAEVLRNPSSDAVVAAEQDYLRQHLSALRTFSAEAGDRGLAVALWWD